jgi:transposase
LALGNTVAARVSTTTSESSRIPNPLRAEMERRRLIAEKLLCLGYSRPYIAKHLKVSYWLVRRWHLQMEHPPARIPKPTGGPRLLAELALHPELRAKRAPSGPPRFLTLDQVRDVWAQPRERRWTGEAFGAAIFEAFGVRYTIKHCCCFLRELKAIAQAKPRSAGA